MSVLLQYPKFQAIDADGAPLSGGLLYTYHAGSSTAKATYSDRELSSANANPVVLDSRGEAVVHFAGRIKLVLKDSDGTEIWTRDNVEAVLQSPSAYFVDASETDHGAAGNGNSVKDLVDSVGGTKEATLIFQHSGSGTTTTFTFSTDETITSNFNLVIEKGARLTVGSGVTLTIEGQIEAGAYQVFAGGGTVTYTSANGVWHNEWESGGSGTKIPDTLELTTGADVNEFSTDGTMAGNSDDAIPTEKAVKTYVDSRGVPSGAVVGFMFSTVPTGWLECNGAAISRSTYSDLFTAVGTAFGVGDGVSTFNIPDLRGRFLRGWDHGAGTDPDAASRTDRGDGTTGDNIGTKQADQNQAHTHVLTPAVQNVAGSAIASGSAAVNQGTSSATDSSGGNEARPKNTNAMFCIKY